MRTITRSPCMAFAADRGGMKRSPRTPVERMVGDEEAVAVAMHREAAGGEFAAEAGDDVAAAAHLHQLACNGEAGERGFELRARVPRAPSSRTSCLKVACACGRAEMCARISESFSPAAALMYSLKHSPA